MNNSKLSKFLPLIIALIAVIGGFLFVRVFMEGEDAIKSDAEIQNSVVTPLVAFSQWLLYIAVGVTVVLSLLSLFKNPENLKKALLGVAALGVVLLVSYFLADSEAVVDAQNKVIEGGEAGAMSNQWTGVGIWMTTFLLGVAGIMFVVDLVKGIVKS